jgi:nucleotide-binding universal stress UspA family protein
MNEQLTRRIAVGIDGSPDAARALAWAIDEAKRRDMTLVLVHGVEVGAIAASPYGGGAVLQQLEASGKRLLEEAVAAVSAEGLPFDCVMEIGSGAHALIEASRNADLVVVGSRGHGGFVGMLLGSVSNACTHHAHCPVVIIRPERTNGT